MMNQMIPPQAAAVFPKRWPVCRGATGLFGYGTGHTCFEEDRNRKAVADDGSRIQGQEEEKERRIDSVDDLQAVE